MESQRNKERSTERERGVRKKKQRGGGGREAKKERKR